MLKNLLIQVFKNNSGDEHVKRVVIIAIAFVAGSILLGAVIQAITLYYPSGADGVIHNILQ